MTNWGPCTSIASGDLIHCFVFFVILYNMLDLQHDCAQTIIFLQLSCIPMSIFADYADTAYSRLLKQPIPIMTPNMKLIICEIRLVELFVSETQTYCCNAQFAHMRFAVCARRIGRLSNTANKTQLFHIKMLLCRACFSVK